MTRNTRDSNFSTVLKVQGLGKEYKLYASPRDRLRALVTGHAHHRSHWALQDVSFSVEEGEIVGIIGHTGSGKSTLIQHLNGLIEPQSGKVYVDGADIWSKQNRKQIRRVRFQVGLCFQYPEYQIFEEDVYKEIAFGPKQMGLDSE